MLSTKEQILLSAKELISEKGYSNTKIEDITKNANLAKGTFYIYFKTKEDLFVEILSEYSEGLQSFTNNIKLEGNLRKNIANFIKEIFNAAIDHENAVKILMIIISDVNIVKKIMTEHKNTKLINFEKFIRDFLEDAKEEIDEKVLKNLEILVGPLDMFIKFYMMSLLNSNGCSNEFKGIKKIDNKELEEKIEIIIDFLYKGLKK